MATSDSKDKKISEVPHLEDVTGVEKIPVSAAGGEPRYVEVKQIVEKAVETVEEEGAYQQKSAIVTPDTDSLQAEAGKLYRFDKEVNTLAVTLPDMDGIEYAADIMLMFKTGDSPSVTISAEQGVEYQQGFKIEAGKHYEVNALWNGAKWIVASLEIVEE